MLATARAIDTSRLPDGWSDPEVIEDEIVADGVSLRRAGIASTGPDGQEVTGSAAEVSVSPTSRSYFELLERVATLDAMRSPPATCALRTAAGRVVGSCAASELFPESDEPARWRYARSNGVALHGTWEAAAARALWELCERDRVMRAWYGEIAPLRLEMDVESRAFREAKTYTWKAFEFPETDAKHFSYGLRVVGLFGFPSRDDLPLAFGYAARPTLSEAVDAAEREAMQLLAFLWGEPVVDRVADLGPTPIQHLEYFQYPAHRERLLRWLDGAHLVYGGGRSPERKGVATVAFVDLTPAWLAASGLHVVKAFCPEASPLAFGDPPFARHLPAELRTHPIA